MEKLKRFKLVIFLIKIFNNRYKCCEKCGMPWNKCTPKVIHINYSISFFCICKHCWYNSKIDELIIYHLKSYNTNKMITTNNINTYTLNDIINSIKTEYINSIELKKERYRKIKLLKNKIKRNGKIKTS